MLIVSYPRFRNMVPIGTLERGPHHPVEAAFAALPEGVDGIAIDYAAQKLACRLLEEHNEERRRQGLRAQEQGDLVRAVCRNIWKNKVAVAAYQHEDELVYVYNHDGQLYLCSGLVSDLENLAHAAEEGR